MPRAKQKGVKLEFPKINRLTNGKNVRYKSQNQDDFFVLIFRRGTNSQIYQNLRIQLLSFYCLLNQSLNSTLSG